MRKLKQRDVKQLAEGPVDIVIDQGLKAAIDVGAQLSGTS